MDIYIKEPKYDANNNFIGLSTIDIIDNATSIIWEPHYRADGKFEIYVEATKENICYLSKENIDNGLFVVRTNDENVGIIENIEIISSRDEGEYITITGKFCESLIGRRIIRFTISLQNTPIYTVVKLLLSQNLLNPPLNPGEIVSPRKMDLFYYDSTNNNLRIGSSDNDTKGTSTDDVLNITTPAITVQIAYENVLEYIYTLLESCNSGLKVVYNEAYSKFEIIFYTGKDRSHAQNPVTLPYVTFSEDFENLTQSSYLHSTEDARNAAYVGGEITVNNASTSYEDIDITVVEKYEEPTAIGLKRKESYEEASDVESSYEDEYGDMIEIPLEQYRPMLQQYAKGLIVKSTETLEGEVDLSPYTYRTDYKIGDIVTIENRLLGVKVNKRIIAVQEVEDENGYSVTPIFEE